MNSVIYSVFVLYVIILIIKRAAFVYYIPLFNVLLDVSFFYLGPGSLATYYRGAVISLFLIFILGHFRYKFPVKKVLIIFLVFTAILTATSSELYFSIKGYTQVFFSLMMLPVGYMLINTPEKLSRLNRQLIVVIYVSVFLTAIGYVFNIGKQFNYGEDEQKIGLLGSAGLYTGAMCIALLPLLINDIKNKTLRLITYFTAVVLYIFILLNMRRTAIMIPFVGIVAFVMTTKKKLQYLAYITATAVLILIGSIWYGDTLKSRFEYRKEAGRFETDFYKTESRYLEVVNLSRSVFSFSDPLASFFGLGHNIFAEHIRNDKIVRRMYHTDFGKLLYGAGIVGLLLYLYFCVRLFIHSNILKKEKGAYLNQVKAMIFALAVINFALMFNGSLNLVTLKTSIFLYLGALIRIYHRERRQLKMKSIANGSVVPAS